MKTTRRAVQIISIQHRFHIFLQVTTTLTILTQKSIAVFTFPTIVYMNNIHTEVIERKWDVVPQKYNKPTKNPQTWPWPQINRGLQLNRYYLSIKFELCRSNHTQVMERKRKKHKKTPKRPQNVTLTLIDLAQNQSGSSTQPVPSKFKVWSM